MPSPLCGAWPECWGRLSLAVGGCLGDGSPLVAPSKSTFPSGRLASVHHTSEQTLEPLCFLSNRCSLLYSRHNPGLWECDTEQNKLDSCPQDYHLWGKDILEIVTEGWTFSLAVRTPVSRLREPGFDFWPGFWLQFPTNTDLGRQQVRTQIPRLPPLLFQTWVEFPCSWLWLGLALAVVGI